MDILPDAKYVCSNHAFLYLAQGGFGTQVKGWKLSQAASAAEAVVWDMVSLRKHTIFWYHPCSY